MPSVTKGTVEVFGFDQTKWCSEELVRLYLVVSGWDLGMSIFSKEMTATRGLGRLLAAWYTVENEGFAGEEWPFYPDVLRPKVARFGTQFFESVVPFVQPQTLLQVGSL